MTRPANWHWHRPGVDMLRAGGGPCTACRMHLADVGTFHTQDAVIVSCLKCLAIMPDHMVEARAMVRSERGLPL